LALKASVNEFHFLLFQETPDPGLAEHALTPEATTMSHECATCGSVGCFYESTDGYQVCSVCLTQSQSMSQIEVMDDFALNGIGLSNVKIRKSFGGGPRKCKSPMLYDRSAPPPSVQKCLEGFQHILRLAALSTAEVAGLGFMKEDFVGTVKKIWIKYLEMWRLGANHYNNLIPDLRLSISDFFMSRHDLWRLDLHRDFETGIWTGKETNSEPDIDEKVRMKDYESTHASDDADAMSQEKIAYNSKAQEVMGGPPRKRARTSIGESTDKLYYDENSHKLESINRVHWHESVPEPLTTQFKKEFGEKDHLLSKCKDQPDISSTKGEPKKDTTEDRQLNRINGYRTHFCIEAEKLFGLPHIQAYRKEKGIRTLKGKRQPRIRDKIVPILRKMLRDASKNRKYSECEMKRFKVYFYVLLLSPSMSFIVVCLYTALLQCRAGVTSGMLLKWVASGRINCSMTFQFLPERLRTILQPVKMFFCMFNFPTYYTIERDSALLQEVLNFKNDTADINSNLDDGKIRPLNLNGVKTSDEQSAPSVDDGYETRINAPVMAARLSQLFGFSNEVLRYAYSLMGLAPSHDSTGLDSDDKINNEWLPPALPSASLQKITQREEVLAVLVVAWKLCNDQHTLSDLPLCNEELKASKVNPTFQTKELGTRYVPFVDKQMKYIGNGPTFSKFLSYLEEVPFRCAQREEHHESSFQWSEKDLHCSTMHSSSLDIRERVIPNVVVAGLANPYEEWSKIVDQNLENQRIALSDNAQYSKEQSTAATGKYIVPIRDKLEYAKPLHLRYHLLIEYLSRVEHIWPSQIERLVELLEIELFPALGKKTSSPSEIRIQSGSNFSGGSTSDGSVLGESNPSGQNPSSNSKVRSESDLSSETRLEFESD